MIHAGYNTNYTGGQLLFWCTSKSGRLKKTTTLVVANFLELLVFFELLKP
jgi:hypothetical protein